MFKWVKCLKHGHDWEVIPDVPFNIAFLFGNTYCKYCGKTMYNKNA